MTEIILKVKKLFRELVGLAVRHMQRCALRAFVPSHYFNRCECMDDFKISFN